MSIKVTATGQGLSRTTNLPNHNSAYTMAGWVNMTSVGTPSGTYRALFDIDAGAAGNTGDILYMTGDGAVPSIWVNNTTSAIGTTVVNTTNWYFMAMVRETATRLLCYAGVNGTLRLDATNTANVAARAATSEIGIGQALSTSSGEDLQSGQFEEIRIWRRALSQSELIQEMRSTHPVNRAGLVGYIFSQTPDEILDYAVGGRWTVTGTLSRGGSINAPLRWPARRRVLQTTAAGTTVSVPLGTLTLTGFAPTVVNPKSVSVPLGTLTLTGFAPGVKTPRTVSVPLASLTLTGFAPTVTKTANIRVSVPLGTLSLGAFIPTVTATAHMRVAVPLGTLAIAAFAPAVVVSGSVAVQIPLGTLSLSGFAPTVIASATQTESNSGGYSAFFDHYERLRAKRRKRLQELEEREEEIERIQNERDKEIAALLLKQDLEEERSKELARLLKLAQEADAQREVELYNERVARAYARAIVQMNLSAIEALQRELDRMMDEDEFLLTSLLLMDED